MAGSRGECNSDNSCRHVWMSICTLLPCLNGPHPYVSFQHHTQPDAIGQSTTSCQSPLSLSSLPLPLQRSAAPSMVSRWVQGKGRVAILGAHPCAAGKRFLEDGTALAMSCISSGALVRCALPGDSLAGPVPIDPRLARCLGKALCICIKEKLGSTEHP
jgi:hypothetical protein